MKVTMKMTVSVNTANDQGEWKFKLGKVKVEWK